MQGSGIAGLETAALDMPFIFIASLASWALHGPDRVLERRVAIGIRQRFTDSLFAKAVGLLLAWHKRHHPGETIESVAKAGDALFGFSHHQFLYLQNAASVIGPIAAIFLLSVPNGLATGIAERGPNLSGGQKQPLALARGILAVRSGSLLMVDEPTSSLDSEIEGRVYDRLLAAFLDSCIVSSIHRLTC